ncbi:MAG: hypothetical protein HYX92_20470 [Chloroflexi bacterium]|nr:hypothetical protein [Chloroflexota bacterium]
MRSLSSSLLEAQKSASSTPYLKVEVLERVAGVTRFPWSRLYSGSEEDFHHAAAMPGDGSLMRARVDASSYQLYVQRVASPGVGSDFATWTPLAAVSSASGVALACQGATVLLFYVGADQQTIYVRESGDYGVTFGSAVSVVTASATVGWLAAALKNGGVAALFYSVGGVAYAVKRVSGVWGSPSAWSNSLSAISGLASVYSGDWNLAVAGVDSSSRNGVWTFLYGDGYSQPADTWAPLKELILSSAGSNVEFRCPSLGYPDVFRLFFVEKYTGAGSYSRPSWSHSLATAEFGANLWREPVPFDLASSYGLAVAHGGAYVWLSSPSGVWRAPLTPISIELSEDLLELNSLTETASGRVRLVLRNDDGRYLGAAAITLGAELRVSPGYRTAAGLESSPGPTYWIDGWEHASAQGGSQFILHASDGWGLLRNWRARRQYAWPAGSRNVFQLLSFVLSRAGLEFSALSYSDAMVNQYPSFTISPGEGGDVAVKRLLAMAPDVLFFGGSSACLKLPLASDDKDYAYGTDHFILEGRYRSEAGPINRAQAYGSGVVGESFAWGELAQVYDRLAQAHDLNLATEGAAQARSDALLRKAAMSADIGEILAPVNCGAEIYDVIEVTDAAAGLSAAKRRVSAVTLYYSAARGRYVQRLRLGRV